MSKLGYQETGMKGRSKVTGTWQQPALVWHGWRRGWSFTEATFLGDKRRQRPVCWTQQHTHGSASTGPLSKRFKGELSP